MDNAINGLTAARTMGQEVLKQIATAIKPPAPSSA